MSDTSSSVIKCSKCDGCQRLRPSKSMLMDYDMETGVVYGALCDECMQVIGILGVLPERTEALLQYLLQREEIYFTDVVDHPKRRREGA